MLALSALLGGVWGGPHRRQALGAVAAPHVVLLGIAVALMYLWRTR